MWATRSSKLADGAGVRYWLERDAKPLAFIEALELWRDDAGFRDFFSRLLLDSPCAAFRWETPPLTRACARRDFEFVLLDSPWLAGNPDPTDFAEHFSAANPGAVITFANLGGDALLVAPGPERLAVDYGHLGSWLRNSSPEQRHALWRAVAVAVLGRLGDKPLWLSTAGGGVPWLHVRIDDRPKYYGYAPYRIPPEDPRARPGPKTP